MQNALISREGLLKSAINLAMGFEKEVSDCVKLKSVEYKDGKKIKEEERLETYVVKKYIPPSPLMLQYLLRQYEPQEVAALDVTFDPAIGEQWLK